MDSDEEEEALPALESSILLCFCAIKQKQQNCCNEAGNLFWNWQYFEVLRHL